MHALKLLALIPKLIKYDTVLTVHIYLRIFNKTTFLNISKDMMLIK